MMDLLSNFFQSHETLLIAMGIISIVTFVVTLVLIPWLVIGLPRDYFAESYRVPVIDRRRHPVIKLIILIGKNLLGVLVLLLGMLMLVIPGQGLLTMLISIILLDFPGKYALQRWLIQRKPVLNSMNWLRARRGRPALVFFT
ncbi:MAG: hypothetical protein O2971_02925 [Proteobacteria bacterium]|nr:hypothetical protein [Pseudomonadota bacterium]